jgi:dihydrolipoamide dehydrogenase
MAVDGEGRLDAIVIGSGAGGLTAASGLARLGRRVALVESGRVGGGRANTGCIPSKRLIHLARDPGLQGSSGDILAAVRRTRDQVRARQEAELRAAHGLELVRGRAALAPGRRVMVHSSETSVLTLTAPHVVIATGSRPVHPEIPGLPPERVLTSEDLIELERLPAHVAVVGAGPVGVETACALARMGGRVTVVEAEPWVLPGADPEAGAVLAAGMRAVGMTVHTEMRPLGFEPEAHRLLLAGPRGATAVEGIDMVLSATGRRPNTDVAAGELAIDERGIIVDSWGRTSLPGVWAVGDVTGRTHQTHGAEAMARRVVQRIALPWVPPLSRMPTIPSAVFADPEVAWVGPGAAERARRFAPGTLVELRVDLAHTDRGITDGLARGFLAVAAVRGTGRIVAATVVGPAASEILPLLTYAVQNRTSILRLQRMVYAYPTHAAAVGAAADLFARRTLPRMHRELAGRAGRQALAALGRLRERVGTAVRRPAVCRVRGAQPADGTRARSGRLP